MAIREHRICEEAFDNAVIANLEQVGITIPESV